MKTTRIAMLAVLAVAPTAVASPAGSSSSEPSPEGSWTGQLSVNGMTLHLVLHVVRQPDDTWTVTMDSPDQGVFGWPFDRVELADAHLVASSEKLHGGFTGQVVGDRLAGTWQQGSIQADLVLTRGAMAIVAKPQEPQPPYPYNVEDVHYPNALDGITLAGTLTLPAGKGPFPAVVLIPGSGLHDRDYTIFGHKIFKLWADVLTRRGVAVLRVDDRGSGGSTGDTATVTSAAIARDVQAGLHYLKSRPEIDGRHLGLVGHSEGGLIAPLVASETPDVAFIVLLAGPGLHGGQIIVQQVGLLTRASGLSEDKVQEAVALQQAVIDIVAADTDKAEARKHLEALPLALGTAPQQQARVEVAIEQLLSPWYRYFVRADPRIYLARVTCPVLALNGDHDLQVAAAPNLAAIRATLESQGNRHVTTLVLPHLNHLLQTSVTGLPEEYGRLDETVAPTVLKTVADWIVLQVQ